MTSINWKQKYKDLKKRTKTLIFEQECLQLEVEKAQLKLLKVSRDNSFLLDRLSQYEHISVDVKDFDATDSSDNDSQPPPSKKRSIIQNLAEHSKVNETFQVFQECIKENEELSKTTK